MNEQWIKIHKKITDWDWYKEGNTFRLFIHFLLNANWKDGNYKGIIIPRGSLVVGRNQLSRDLNLSPQKIRTSIKHLKLTNEITIKITNKFSIVTVVNYEKYQKTKAEVTNRTSDEQPSSNHQVTTIEEYRHIDNIDIKNKNITSIVAGCENDDGEDFEVIDNIEFEFLNLWKEYPNKQGKVKALKSYRKHREKYSKEEIEVGLLKYIEHIKDKNISKQYIKHGSTWFFQECWNDEYEIEEKDPLSF